MLFEWRGDLDACLAFILYLPKLAWSSVAIGRYRVECFPIVEHGARRFGVAYRSASLLDAATRSRGSL
jgi:hypothetical protein